jgi:hypothetical protein
VVTVPYQRGDENNPLSEEEVLAKFAANADLALGHRGLASTRSLTALLAGQ